jgi:hypothetical protein
MDPTRQQAPQQRRGSAPLGSASQLNLYAGGLIRYDPNKRRVWIVNQRLHHGLTGAMLAAAGMALMVHDRHDRTHWLERGPQSPA